MSAATTPAGLGAGFGPGGPPEGPGWESAIARWLPRAALVAALGVGGLWWVSTCNPGPRVTSTEQQAENVQRRKRSEGCDCGADDCDGCASCAEIGCDGADCLSGLGDCGAADCGGCDCGAIDCGSCDCGAVDCGGLDCGSCASVGVRGGSVRAGAASVGASCPRRGLPSLSVLALLAPLGLFALWRARSPRA